MLPNLDFDPGKLRPTLLALGGQHSHSSWGNETYFFPDRPECAQGWGLESVGWNLENENIPHVTVRCEQTCGSDTFRLRYNPVDGDPEISVTTGNICAARFAWEKRDFFSRAEKNFSIEIEFLGKKSLSVSGPAKQKRYSLDTGIKKLSSAFSREHRECFEHAKGVLRALPGEINPLSAPWFMEPKWLETLNLVIKEIDELDRKPSPRLPRVSQPELDVNGRLPRRQT